jgi:4-aminobutyrate aminotransferase-like enzyme
MANIKKKLLEELENIVKEEVVVYVIDEGHTGCCSTPKVRRFNRLCVGRPE